MPQTDTDTSATTPDADADVGVVAAAPSPSIGQPMLQPPMEHATIGGIGNGLPTSSIRTRASADAGASASAEAVASQAESTSRMKVKARRRAAVATGAKERKKEYNAVTNKMQRKGMTQREAFKKYTNAGGPLDLNGWKHSAHNLLPTCNRSVAIWRLTEGWTPDEVLRGVTVAPTNRPLIKKEEAEDIYMSTIKMFPSDKSGDPLTTTNLAASASAGPPRSRSTDQGSQCFDDGPDAGAQREEALNVATTSGGGPPPSSIDRIAFYPVQSKSKDTIGTAVHRLI